MLLLAELRADSCRSVKQSLCGIPTAHEGKNPKNSSRILVEFPGEDSSKNERGFYALRKVRLWTNATAGDTRLPRVLLGPTGGNAGSLVVPKFQFGYPTQRRSSCSTSWPPRSLLCQGPCQSFYGPPSMVVGRRLSDPLILNTSGFFFLRFDLWLPGILRS